MAIFEPGEKVLIHCTENDYCPSAPGRGGDYFATITSTTDKIFFRFETGETCYHSPEYTRDDGKLAINKINNQNTMNDKFYRVIKDTYIWQTGAILKLDGNVYRAVDDIWNVEGNDVFNKKLSEGVVECKDLVENSPAWFERVYSVKSLRGLYYVAKDKMKDLLSKGVVDAGDDGEVTGV